MSSRGKVEFFNQMGSRYEDVFGRNAAQSRFVSESLETLIENSPPGAQLSVLDAGCGTGKPTGPLVIEKGIRLHGFDFSPVMVDISRKQVPEGEYECVNVMDFSLANNDPYDAAFAILSLLSLNRSEMEELAKRWGDWVKPGGYLFICTMDVGSFPTGVEFEDFDDLGGRVKRRCMGVNRSFLVFTRNGWKQLLQQSGFEIVKSDVRPFQPAVESGDWEPHLYLTCRKRG